MVTAFKSVTAKELKSWLNDVMASSGSLRELAVIDVREPGQFGEGHLFFATPVAYSNFEHRFIEQVPRQSTRTVLIDNDDGVAERAAQQASALGYSDVYVLRNGVEAWHQAGYTLFKGVNVPSKTFGELLEHKRETPRISAEELQRRQHAGENLVILDGRPGGEFRTMSIPAASCCPNGELLLRADSHVPNPQATVVINCAGRTRSILGAQTLIDAGFPNPVVALENGTQGWVLAGLELERGMPPELAKPISSTLSGARREKVETLAKSAGVEFLQLDELSGFASDTERTLCLLDVRTLEEFDNCAVAGSRHAPGGQLVQATDQWVAVRGARIVLLDSDGIRAPMCAYWLRQLGHEASVMKPEFTVGRLVDEGFDQAAGAAERRAALSRLQGNTVTLSVADLQEQGSAQYQIVDLRSSADYRLCHLEGARWSVRPRISQLQLSSDTPVLLLGNQQQAECVGMDLCSAGCDCYWLIGSADPGAAEDWQQAGLVTLETADSPADEDRIDYLVFTAKRHQGDRADSLLYLEWEQNLLNQIDEQERNSFNLVNT